MLTTILNAQGPTDAFSRRRYRQQYLAYRRPLPPMCAPCADDLPPLPTFVAR